MCMLISFLAVLLLVFPLNIVHSEKEGYVDSWGGSYESSMDLEVTHVSILLAAAYSNNFKKGGNNTLGGPGPGPGRSNFLMDAYTAPSWASTVPSVFTAEQYEFAGGSSVYIDYRVVVVNNAGPWPTPISVTFAWQECGHSVIYPPLPKLLYNHDPLILTLPFEGIWYATFSIRSPQGAYDWGALARYDGLYPIPLPPDQDTDMIGMEGYPTWRLHNVNDRVGDGRGSGRPWCFEVIP